MKTIIKKSLVAVLISVLFISSGIAQGPQTKGQGNGPGCNQGEPAIERLIPDLTDDQIVALKELRTAHFKEMKDFKNQMGEVNAKKRTIMSADPIDKNAAEKIVDQQTALMNKEMKAQVAHKAALQEILSEEQMLAMEQHQQHRQMAQNNGPERNGRRGDFGPNHPQKGRNSF